MRYWLTAAYQLFNDTWKDVKWDCPCCTAKMVDSRRMYYWVAKANGIRVCPPCLNTLYLLEEIEW